MLFRSGWPMPGEIGEPPAPSSCSDAVFDIYDRVHLNDLIEQGGFVYLTLWERLSTRNGQMFVPHRGFGLGSSECSTLTLNQPLEYTLPSTDSSTKTRDALSTGTGRCVIVHWSRNRGRIPAEDAASKQSRSKRQPVRHGSIAFHLQTPSYDTSARYYTSPVLHCRGPLGNPPILHNHDQQARRSHQLFPKSRPPQFPPHAGRRARLPSLSPVNSKTLHLGS